ncbi:MAG TPA: helix-turn-helix domain-containing protein [Casimicrobiaceae bacterium]|nr:helix-turn-helix domain-containing protein [Casimicrobiaceae bacterium]
MSSAASLASRRADLAQRLILDAGIDLLEHAGAGELTMRGVAAGAGISERTVFRYFGSRDELLDAIAQEATRRMTLPPDPASVAALFAYPAALFERFEATAALTRAALHPDIFHRIRTTEAKRRWKAIEALLDVAAPDRTVRERRLAAANIRYHLSATSWNYFRAYFGFSPADAIAAAQLAVAQALRALGIDDPALVPGDHGGRDAAPRRRR